MDLITTSNPKTMKGEQYNYHTAVLHLSPHTSAGIKTASGEELNVCPFAINCPDICLNYSGRGGIGDPEVNKIQIARRRRTEMWFYDRAGFLKQLGSEIEREMRKAARLDMDFAFRPNGTSDLPGLGSWAAETFPSIQVYDYTKIPHPWLRARDNYHLTFSYDGDNWEECQAALNHGINVAVVFHGEFPKTFMKYRVINGDESDLRFRDPSPRIIALKAKGPAKKDQGVFTIKEVA